MTTATVTDGVLTFIKICRPGPALPEHAFGITITILRTLVIPLLTLCTGIHVPRTKDWEQGQNNRERFK